MNGDISKEEFLQRYRDPASYRPECDKCESQQALLTPGHAEYAGAMLAYQIAGACGGVYILRNQCVLKTLRSMSEP